MIASRLGHREVWLVEAERERTRGQNKVIDVIPPVPYVLPFFPPLSSPLQVYSSLCLSCDVGIPSLDIRPSTPPQPTGLDFPAIHSSSSNAARIPYLQCTLPCNVVVTSGYFEYHCSLQSLQSELHVCVKIGDASADYMRGRACKVT